MRTLRSRSDAVMIGGGTLRAEKLSLGLDAEDPGPVPLAVVLTNTGDVPLEGNLVLDHRQELVVLLSESVTEESATRLGHLAEVRRVPGSASGLIDPAKALKLLTREYGVGVLLVEGGPALNHSLISYGLVDELFLTVAPTLLGGIEAQTLLRGPEIPVRHRPNLDLLSIYLADSELFLRYSLTRNRTGSF